VDGTATCRGMEGPDGITRFSLLCTLSDLTWGPPSPLYSGFRGVALTTHPPSSAKVKEIVQLYYYSPTPVWHVTWKALPYTSDTWKISTLKVTVQGSHCHMQVALSAYFNW
jgi:hypothetical protein